mgnify:CR=1 FL=1
MNCKFLKIIGIGFILSVSTLANATLIDYGDYLIAFFLAIKKQPQRCLRSLIVKSHTNTALNGPHLRTSYFFYSIAIGHREVYLCW